MALTYTICFLIGLIFLAIGGAESKKKDDSAIGAVLGIFGVIVLIYTFFHAITGGA